MKEAELDGGRPNVRVDLKKALRQGSGSAAIVWRRKFEDLI